jgi:metal-dependent hydrolase (beta-lactamase superfamily II)
MNSIPRSGPTKTLIWLLLFIPVLSAADSDINPLHLTEKVCVINTHHHWDHTFGNQVFADAKIIGHVLCSEDMQTVYGSKENINREIQDFMEIRLRDRIRDLA